MHLLTKHLSIVIPTTLLSMATSIGRCHSSSTKTLWILRHGQALHNPRAEAARAAGCSKATFLEWMRRDDALDAPLTRLGVEQAHNVRLPVVPDVVVASPLSRALQTADGACPTCERRICYEGFREINGWLLNAKRRTKTELEMMFPKWDFGLLETETDVLWGPELEDERACGERGYEGLKWLARHFEDDTSILLVVHGGLLSFTLQLEPHVILRDGRSSGQQELRLLSARFSNCELRRYELKLEDQEQVILTEVDVDAATTAAALSID